MGFCETEIWVCIDDVSTCRFCGKCLKRKPFFFNKDCSGKERKILSHPLTIKSTSENDMYTDPNYPLI